MEAPDEIAAAQLSRRLDRVTVVVVCTLTLVALPLGAAVYFMLRELQFRAMGVNWVWGSAFGAGLSAIWLLFFGSQQVNRLILSAVGERWSAALARLHRVDRAPLDEILVLRGIKR